ncbi:MAG: class I mannose-6-phosphate isomerase [Sedimentisphaerales bacterium]|nr:class I mannose-6-phosphate isomerase [Sedimentisphaerales bacterium]
MSFMFNPHPYDDKTAINKINLKDNEIKSILKGSREIAAHIAGEAVKKLVQKDAQYVIGIDGYITAEIEPLCNLIAQCFETEGYPVKVVSVSEIYKSSNELESFLQPYLPIDPEKDPVRLFGSLFEGDFSAVFDTEKLNVLTDKISKKEFSEKIIIVQGYGAAHSSLRDFYNSVIYLDVIPKEVVLRVKNGKVRNLGDAKVRSHRDTMRRNYYFDFEIAGKLRAEILNDNLAEYYLLNNSEEMQMLPAEVFNEICSQLATQPFRCKPVYNEGVWGGYYTISQRNLPESMKNCAWVFDLIPLEVSVMVKAGEHLLDIPYFTFVKKQGVSLMGKQCVEKFGGYFPIRFNYDDTYHSNGNMSVQVHSGHDYNKENYNEHGRQDESYYVIATGHDAKTYCGFKEDADVDEFWEKVKDSEVNHVPVDYQKYVRAEPSCPGKQFLLPAGTIHASGRNQLILEIGSLTVGSYTYKLYDYLRLDLDGKPRPIHTYHGKNVLKTDRKGSWVKLNLIPEPVTLQETDDWKEIIVGEHDLIYFSLRRVEFDKFAEQDTNGVFHVLTLVDGEKVVVESMEEPDRSYTLNYLDMVVVPANIGKYRIRNLGNQSIKIHKTLLKDGFQND